MDIQITNMGELMKTQVFSSTRYFNREGVRTPSHMAFSSQPHDLKIFLQNSKTSRENPFLGGLCGQTTRQRFYCGVSVVSQRGQASRAPVSLSTRDPIPSRIEMCPFISTIQKNKGNLQSKTCCVI